jgi:hypothetical protein
VSVGDDTWFRPLGGTGLRVSAVTLGASPLGFASGADGYRDAVELIRSALASPITVIDTSNGYGDSERRIGDVLREIGGLPADRLVITKVDPKGSDYSGARVRESIRESKLRLGITASSPTSLRKTLPMALGSTSPTCATDALPVSAPSPTSPTPSASPPVPPDPDASMCPPKPVSTSPPSWSTRVGPGAPAGPSP